MPVRINLPPLTRAIIVVELCFSLIAGALRYSAWVSRAALDNNAPLGSPPPEFLASTRIQYLTVVPALSIIYPWTQVTASFVEANIFTLVITLATFFYGGKYLERAWGGREFAKFLGVVSVGSNVIALAIYVIWYAISSNVERNFTSISGGVALQAGFLVAFKQLVPEHTVTLFKGVIKMRVKHFPALFIFFNLLSGLIIGTDVAAILAINGFLTSWIYLRFYKKQYVDLSSSQPVSLRGDASETFAFAHFFPDSLYPFISPITNTIYGLAVAVKLCIPFTDEDVQAGNSRVAASSANAGGFAGILGPPGGRLSAARQEAERRRALALKVLDQRLHAATTMAGRPGGNGSAEMLGGTSFTPEDGDMGVRPSGAAGASNGPGGQP
ncbi:hypothetical protein H072_1032 [Dactylellina haptotyla CBS 200.50]|uniref:Peptidase S54 rhomboid domain-containing protein n=1 Tax=Dactylellina haptotyla (strain CBS 200.50) TaxID=1284197 RepID=S8BZY2_DACHA|nr:hypothetical protein H072_1032 [Dactylellina haptotyla CBS 200.50]